MKVSAARIDSVTVGSANGRIGMTGCPGSLYFGGLRTAPDEDLEIVRTWGAHGLVSLVEAHELHALDIANLGERTAAAGMWWRHLPIVDMEPPDASFETRWLEERRFLHDELASGRPFVVHCLAGLGRTGTVVARLLVESGAEVEQAILAVRANRPGAIQTSAQEDWLWALPPAAL